MIFKHGKTKQRNKFQMTRKDWTSVGIHNEIVEGIDAFLQTEEAKNLNLKSRQEFLNLLARQYLERYEKSRSKQLFKKIDPELLNILDRINKEKD